MSERRRTGDSAGPAAGEDLGDDEDDEEAEEEDEGTTKERPESRVGPVTSSGAPGIRRVIYISPGT